MSELTDGAVLSEPTHVADLSEPASVTALSEPGGVAEPLRSVSREGMSGGISICCRRRMDGRVVTGATEYRPLRLHVGNQFSFHL